MKKLVIAEKPSLARKIMDALKTSGDTFTSMCGGEYYESNKYIVTSQFGHLLELMDINDYPENKDKNMWDKSNLPFFPINYKYVLKKDVKQRFATINKLVSSSDIDEVIHCGDPDREGQVLVDLVLVLCNCKKRVTRPLLKTLTDDGILKAFAERKDNKCYINWRNEGLVRMYVDNDFGKNLSRYATTKTYSKPALNVGRVIGAIVTEIYNRDIKIANFKPVKYYKVESDTEIKLTSKKEFDINNENEAKMYAKQLNETPCFVQSVITKEVKKKSPKLFSQTALQGALNKKYGFAPDKTLELAQALYEKGFTTYPRTNTEYMTEAEKDEVKTILNIHNDNNLIFKNSKNIFDDTKIEGHSAIIPTHQRPSALKDDEQKCYDVILNRFKAVFCKEDCIYNKTEAKITCDGMEDFTIKGEVLVTKGWQVYEDINQEDKVLPPLIEGQEIKTNFDAREAETTAPKPYTVESLGKWLQNPFKKDSDSEDEAYQKILAGLEIGTEATRAGIIKKAQDKEYIELKKSTYKILPRGIFLVEACNELGINMSKEKTAEMGKMTKDVYKGVRTIDDVLNISRKEITEIICMDADVRKDEQTERKSFGKCPLCGGTIYENRKAYGCSGYKQGCTFTLWKTVAGKKLTKKQVETLLAGETTPTIKGFKSKSGKDFSAKLRLKADNTGVEFVFTN